MIINEPLDRKSDSRAGKNESESSICSKTEYDILFVFLFIFLLKIDHTLLYRKAITHQEARFFFFFF